MHPCISSYPGPHPAPTGSGLTSMDFPSLVALLVLFCFLAELHNVQSFVLGFFHFYDVSEVQLCYSMLDLYN